MKAGLARAVVGTAVGGLLVLLSSGRQWSHAKVVVPGAAVTGVSVTGHAVEPALPALGIALLALAGGLIAARGVLRRVVGGVIVATGVSALAVSVAGRGSVSSALTSHEVGGLAIPAHGSANGWWLVAAVGGLLALVCGVLSAARSRNWAALGRKYEVPDATSPVAVGGTEASAWDALDRGEDPTE